MLTASIERLLKRAKKVAPNLTWELETAQVAIEQGLEHDDATQLKYALEKVQYCRDWANSAIYFELQNFEQTLTEKIKELEK